MDNVTFNGVDKPTDLNPKSWLHEGYARRLRLSTTKDPNSR